MFAIIDLRYKRKKNNYTVYKTKYEFYNNKWGI